MWRELVITDGAAGNVRQAEALAAALAEVGAAEAGAGVAVRWPAPWSWLAPRLIGRGPRWPRALADAMAAVGAAPGGAAPDDDGALDAAARARPPLLAIGCGRAAALATRLLRRRHGARAVQILAPRIDPAHWDVVIAPMHDAVAGANVVQTVGSLHRITPALLAAQPKWAAADGARVMLAVGDVDVRYLRTLLAELAARPHGELLVTASRRTSEAALAVLRGYAASRAARWHEPALAAANPYLEFLANAGEIVVTPDSVNMLSEACATGVPVYVMPRADERGKLARFHATLFERGHARPLARRGAAWAPVPLREMDHVVHAVRARLGC